MVQLSGNNLPERQHSLNNQVNEAASKGVPFNNILAEKDASDVEILFKIDLAAKYKNIDYVIEILKNGDSFHISRVLKKCNWLYGDDFSNFINSDYLHHNVFPYMSLKMKKKLLTTASVNIKNENRAVEFYEYCSNTKQQDLAYKFLIFTSESVKLKFLQENHKEFLQRDDYLKHFIGYSFTLLEAYIINCHHYANKNDILYNCSYLYNVSDIKYLDLLEKYVKTDRQFTNLGLRISKDITVKHKKRIIDHPDIYLPILNLGKLLRHSSLNEVDFYSVFLLPKNISEFWRKSHQATFRQIINVVPEMERYAFAKKIFANVYHDEEFEMSKQFYEEKYLVNLMTPSEKESWALQHLANGKETLGSGNDYIWYKFLNFEKAFSEIKKCIHSATDKTKRSDLIDVLIQSAMTNKEVEAVLQYYYGRHVNENKSYKISFMRRVIAHHNVFKFDDNCWTAFDKILHSVKVYDEEGDPELKIVAILYHILNDKAMPEALKNYMETSMAMYSAKIHIENEKAENRTKVYDYLFKFYVDKIVKSEPGSKDDKVVICVHFLLELMAMFDKTKNDIPDIVMEFINQNKDSFKYKRILEQSSNSRITENHLIKCLKQDPKQIFDILPEIQKVITGGWNFQMKRFTSKLKVYFPDDVSNEFVKLFNDWLCDYKTIPTAIFGLIQLNDEESNIKLMNKYVPKSAKRDWGKEDTTVMRIQESICRYACYSRPPVPLENVFMYLKGDYVQFCLPMFSKYLSNLPMPLCLKFVESLLDSPVSIQKHGLRLAFQCFGAENLKKLVLNAWKNTRNVSLRKVIYKALFEKVKNEKDKELCTALKTLTLDLKDTDDDDLFSLLDSDKYQLPGDYLADLTEAYWATVKEFNDNEQNVQRKIRILQIIESNINFMKKETVQEIVAEHAKSLFGNAGTKIENVNKHKYLYSAKWKLLTHYIEFFSSTEPDLSESVEIAQSIVHECLKRWNDVACEIYVYRKLLWEFIADLNQTRYLVNLPNRNLIPDTKSYENAVPVFEKILTDLQASLPLNDIYLYLWTLRIIVACRRVVKESRLKYSTDIEVKAIEEIATEFGTKVANMVKETVESNTYFAYFSENIKKIICNAADEIRTHLSGGTIEVEKQNIELSIARGLLACNAKEANLLALRIVPLDMTKCDLDLYKLVYKTLKDSSDPEVQCCIDMKFSGDFKRRRLE